MRLQGLHFDDARIGELCRSAGVVRLYLFGSVLTNRFDAHSDIDVLVETEPARPVGLLTLGGLQMDLSDLLGRRVHLTLLGGVPEPERVQLLSHARMLNAA